ncbi:hypothetical protein T01_179 [Trichinella spiralis]|uniref:Uncharacterized protein n=1 Tax=Trichinella spiralis TaxID=6334 RepID=A0A0V1AM69_TRISP|nr:hypothetical protein T01_179 [Trichinella spiralis]
MNIKNVLLDLTVQTSACLYSTVLDDVALSVPTTMAVETFARSYSTGG